MKKDTFRSLFWHPLAFLRLSEGANNNQHALRPVSALESKAFEYAC